MGIVAGVLFSYGTLTGRDAGFALLILLAAMKLLEMAGPRDFYIAAFIGLFLMLTNFFYSQTLPMGAYTALCVGTFVMAFISYSDARGAVERQARLRLAGILLLQALPVAIVLFLLFPRIPGPLWGLPKDARGAQTGLDDQMIPGAISDLTLSDEVAFRVEFLGEPPPRSTWYWRGPVLWFTDGVKWVPDGRRAVLPKVERRGQPVRYAVTLEPTERSWLFALELPAEPPEDARLSPDLLLHHRRDATRAPWRWHGAGARKGWATRRSSTARCACSTNRSSTTPCSRRSPSTMPSTSSCSRHARASASTTRRPSPCSCAPPASRRA